MKSGAEEALSWLEHWGLVPDGPEIRTASSLLLPVRRGDSPLMLKLAQHEEEARGNALMAWWAGQGAAKVIAQEGAALLLEKAEPASELSELDDDIAIPILCDAALALQNDHTGKHPPTDLVPFDIWISDLTAPDHGNDLLDAAAKLARECLTANSPAKVLHGDIHHGNVLRFSDGWKVIDPKGILGPLCFEFANILPNPLPSSLDRGRFSNRLGQVVSCTGLPAKDLALWAFVWPALSSIWSEQAGDEKAARRAFAFAKMARSVSEEFG